MGSNRKRRRLVAAQKQVVRDEELGRFGRLVGVVLVLELVALIWITGGVRPL